MRYNVYLYIFTVFLVIYLIRALPLALIKKKITNKTIRSFLYYVPYVTLAVMTFPAIIEATNSIYSGIAALFIGMILSYIGANLFTVAVSSCVIVFIIEYILKLF